MISPRLRIDHFDPGEWKRVHRLMNPPSQAPAHRSGPPRPSSPPLVLFIEEGRCVKALRVHLRGDGGEANANAGQGVVGATEGTGGSPRVEVLDPASFGWAGAWSLGKLRRAVGAKLALAIEGDALERAAAAIDGQLRVSDDLVAQLLVAARAGKAELGKGFHLDPDPFSSIPVPSYAALQQTFDLLLPDDRSAGLFLFDRDRRTGREQLYTSLVIEKRGGDVVRLTSHRALEIDGLDFRAGRHRAILDGMSRRVAPPAVALFASLEAWRDVVGPDPGALARQLALREAVLDPAPAWLVALTGATAMAGVAQEASRLFGRFIPQSIKDTARAVTASPFNTLGFDPIQLFTQLRSLFE